MKNRPVFVSIIVPVKNQSMTIRKCIDSLLKLNYPKYEIIIVDNGSKDNSSVIVRRYKNKKIKLLFEQKPGAYNARNKGIRVARGSIIAFTDGDCVVHKDWLKFLVQPFKNIEICGVGGKVGVYQPKNEFELYCNKFYHLNELYIRKSYLITANVAYRKKVLEEAGLFDGELPSGGDVDMSWKTIKLGYKLCFEPRAFVAHIYKETPIEMFKKFFWHGKYQALLNIKYGLPPKKKENRKYMTSLKQMFRKYPLKWILYRIIQDVSFHFGLFYGGKVWRIKLSLI